MTAKAAQPKKDSCPRTEHGTIDWEVVFEKPDAGLIALVDQTNTPDGVLRVCRVIIHSLFSRDGDAETRVHFEKEINEIMVSSDPSRGFALEPQKVLIIDLLREIKENRILNASFHAARQQQQDKLNQNKRQPAAASPTFKKFIAPDRDSPEYVEDAFAMALTEMLAHRMQPLIHGAKPDIVKGALPAFAVSGAFLDRLLDMVYGYMAEEMESACRTIIRKAENEPPDRQVDFIVENMENRQSRQVLWEAWKTAWALLTEQRDPPPRPKETAKKGLFGKIKREEPSPSWQGGMTMEEWEAAVTEIEEGNELAAEIWGELTAPSDAFQCPTDKDKKILRNLFARTPAAIEKQITAVCQIAEQDGNRAKIFAEYQSGKDIDLPLLAASYRRPDLFIERGILRDIMRSFPQTMRRSQFTLVSRYFAEILDG